MNTDLRRALEVVARRHRQVRLWGSLALCWLGWGVLGWGLAGEAVRPDAGPWPSAFLPAWALALAATGTLCVILARRSAADPRRVAGWIEAKHPELGTGLLAAVEEDAKARPGRVAGFLQSAVIRQALEHRAAHDWSAVVPGWKLHAARSGHAAAAALLVAATVGLVGAARTRANDPRSFASAAGGAEVRVEPGNAEVERGSPLLVVARFGGPVPGEASLVVEDAAGKSGATRAMTRSLEDPTFAGRVESVGADLDYRVEFAGRSSPTYRVTVFEYPELRRTDARMAYPAYTGLETKVAEDIRHVTAVEGTELTLDLHLNKEVVEAGLVDEKDRVVPLARRPGDEPVYTAGLTLADSHRYRVKLVDAENRTAKGPPEIVVNVTRNRPAAVAMTRPSRDVRVSPVEELKLQARVEDDYGVIRHGLSYTAAGAGAREVALKGPEAATKTKKLTAEHLLDFESLKLPPDALVTYFFWAEDVGPDGKPRRSSGDMFFAEVRHFEEIFRQGEAPPGGSADQQAQQGQAAQQAAKLAELQKQIINGTWKLIRREAGAQPSDRFAEDVGVLRESQASAIEQAGQLATTLRDATSKENLKSAVDSMTDAEKRLAEAATTPAVRGLDPPLAAEQAAYQALLKLRAREFEVTRNSRQQQGGGGAASPSQQQLDQLELSAEENRYEQQRSARAQQDQGTRKQQDQRENRQVLNRLRELAQRQGDLNERIKELKAALEAAKDDKAREELDRQLKRLRDQQQQLLRDTDEVKERMEREENRDRMAEARQQVEQGRENVRQASEALEQGKLSQAVTEATRAGQKLKDLGEDLRKKGADRFAEELTEMRDRSRRLEEDQKKLTDQLDAWDRRPQRTLRDDGERQGLGQGLDRQSKELGGLLDRMRATVQDAEETEPLLAKELFDAARKADGQAIPGALKEAGQLVDAGVADEAAKSSRKAGQGLEQLREGVERASKSVLGDETAALKRAEGELGDLADQVDRELARSTDPDPAGRPDAARGQQPGGTEGQSRPGQPAEPSAPGTPSGQPARQSQARRDRQAQQPGQPGGQDRRPGPGDQGGQEPGGPAQQPGQGGQPGEPGQGGQQPGGQPGGQPGAQGQTPGTRPGQGRGDQSGQRPGGAQGESPGGEPGSQPGQQPGGAEGQPGQGQGQGKGQGQGQGDQPGRPGQGAGGGQPAQPGGGGRGEQRQAGPPNGGGGGGGGNGGGLDRVLEGIVGGPVGPGGPITGEGFRRWSDRMRDVEELIPDTGMRAEAARIRDRVRGAREEFKRHSKPPDPTQLKAMVAEPIRELRDRVAQEVRRRESPDALVPIDRDPVPPQFTEGVRRYYERLGSGR